MDRVDRVERLVNLVAALIDAERPLTREQLQSRVGGYSDDPEAFRRNFERDKDLLRQMGMPLQTEPLDPDRPEEQFGYRIPREKYELPDPGLDSDELAALRLAASVVEIDGSWGRDATTGALRKLAGSATGPAGPETSADDGALAPGGGVAELPGGDAVALVFGAVVEQRRLRFAYRGEARLVDPWRLSFRRGKWYLSGWDHHRGEARLFRLDRVEGAIAPDGSPTAFARPTGFDAAPLPPWRMGDGDEVVVDLLVDADQARWAEVELGHSAVLRYLAGGSVRCSVPVTNQGAFRSFVLGFLDHAEILGPAEVRDEMICWLRALAPGQSEAE